MSKPNDDHKWMPGAIDPGGDPDWEFEVCTRAAKAARKIVEDSGCQQVGVILCVNAKTPDLIGTSQSRIMMVPSPEPDTPAGFAEMIATMEDLLNGAKVSYKLAMEEALGNGD